MPRTNETAFTQQELTDTVNWAAPHDVPVDSTPEGEANQTFIRDYFIKTWQQDATPANLAAASEQLLPHLKQRDPAEALALQTYLSSLLGYEKEEAQAWVAPKGFVPCARNFNVLFAALSSRNIRITRENLTWAAQRFASQIQWDGSNLPRNKTPNEAYREAKNIDPSDVSFLGPKSEINKTPLQYKREAEARSEADAAPDQKTVSSRLQASAQREAESLRGGSHSENDQLRRLFVMIPGTNNVDWVSTNNARKDMQARQNKARQIQGQGWKK